MITEGYKIAKIPKDAPVITWKNFMKLSKCCFYNYKVERNDDDPAVILYSGGTTGTTKGIMLTNRNFNALAEQVSRGQDAGRHARLPRLRPRSLHPYDAGQGRKMRACA